MKKKMVKMHWMIALLFMAMNFAAFCQTDEIKKIVEQIKVSQDLEKLNDCRIRLRAIDFSLLKTKESQLQYADAYKQLAWAFKNHKYIRPAYDIYLKHISLNDTILQSEKNKQENEILSKHATLNTSVHEEIATAEQERKSLMDEKTILDGIKKSYFRYSVFITIVLLISFLLVFINYNNKLKKAKILLLDNRSKLLEMHPQITKAQISVGILSQLKQIISKAKADQTEIAGLISEIERDLKGIKESEQNFKSINENQSKLKQVIEIANTTLTRCF